MSKTAKRVGVLTCVTNGLSMGPGHTALVVDGNVYTFETFAAGWTSTGTSGWRILSTGSYLAENTGRPVAVQELKTSVNATSVLNWILQDDKADSDYASAGVCSQRAAMALSAGVGFKVDPTGFNTPYAVYQFLDSKGVVAKTYYTGAQGNARQQILLVNNCTSGSKSYQKPAPILQW